jgi:hypothetical protein
VSRPTSSTTLLTCWVSIISVICAAVRQAVLWIQNQIIHVRTKFFADNQDPDPEQFQKKAYDHLFSFYFLLRTFMKVILKFSKKTQLFAEN